MAETTYQNFDLSIESVGAGYRARVIASPAGEATEEITLPALDLVADTQPAQVAGGRLFTAVFRGEVLTGFRRSADKARQRGAGLRIRLRLSGVPELANLPWEHLYDATRGRFLALSNETQVVRYLDLPEPVRPLKVRAPLRILAVIASPADFPALDTEREWASLQAALADPLARSAVEVERLEPATLAALQRRLRRSNYHILHFMGHGAFDPQTQEGVLMLEDDARQGRPVSGQDVGTLLHDHRPLRLALLNACAGAVTAAGNPFGGVAQSLVQQGIPAVVAMRAAISDGAAQAFASEFYAAIADGYPVDAAVTEARKAISAQGNADEWGTPVLFMRAADGRLFDLAAEKVEEPAPAPREEPAPQPEVSGARGVYTQRARPALGGDSISHYHAGAATFGCLVQDRADPRRVYILCDYSGLSSGTSVSRAGDPVVQPGRYDGGNPAGDIVAAIARWATVRASPLAAADNVSATLAEVNDLADVSPHIRGRGFLKGVRAASSTARVYAVGRTAGQMQGTVVRVDAHTMVAWPRDQIVGPVQGTGDGSGLVLIPFDGLIECTPMLLPGDSGAVLVDGDNYALGLGFAGNDAASMFLPMQRVLDALNVDLVTEEIWRSLMQPAAQLARPPIAATLNSDVYISYHEADRAWVLGELMPWLESAGLTALVDVRDFDIAAPRLESIARAVETSRHTLAVLTPDYVAAEWEQLETLSARTADPAAQRRKLVPLKLKPCTLPSSIAAIGLGYADLTDAFASKYALPNLLKALGARRPATAPAPSSALRSGRSPTEPSPAPSSGRSPTEPSPAPSSGRSPTEPSPAPSSGRSPTEPPPAPRSGRSPTEPSSALSSGRSPIASPAVPGTEPSHAPTAYARELTAIAEKLQQARLVLFIGADLPESATGLPGRPALAEGLAARSGLPAGQRLATVAQQVMQAGQRFEFTDFIRNALDLTGKAPQAFHQGLARLIQRYRPETIFTVAYDAMLETALRQASVSPEVVVRESQLRFVRGDRPALYKLYGDCDQVDTLVVTEQDQNALLRGRVKAELVDELRRAFRRSTLLFLGYDLADPVVAALFDEVAGGSFQAPAYAAWPGLPESQRTSLKSNRNLTVLDLDPVALIEALLG